MSEDHSNEMWVDLYRTALLKLQHSLMAGKIFEARAAIVARLELLETHPALHLEERRAIADALNGLRCLQTVDDRITAAEQKEIAAAALRKLQAIEPKIVALSSLNAST